jgi:hypothetical protein
VKGGGDGDRSCVLKARYPLSLLNSVRDLCGFGLTCDFGGGDGERRGFNLGPFSPWGDLLLDAISPDLGDAFSTSSTVVERASREVFRFSLIGESDLGDDGDSDILGRVSSAMSIFVSTFLKGGRVAGLGFTPGDSGSSPDMPSPWGLSGEASCVERDVAFENVQIIMVPSNPVLTIVDCRLEPSSLG